MICLLLFLLVVCLVAPLLAIAAVFGGAALCLYGLYRLERWAWTRD